METDFSTPHLHFCKYLMKNTIRQLFLPQFNGIKIGILSGGYLLFSHAMMKRYLLDGRNSSYICMAISSALMSFVFLDYCFVGFSWCIRNHHTFVCCFSHL